MNRNPASSSSISSLSEADKEIYLRSDDVINFDHPLVQAFANEHASDSADPVDISVNLYYAVRDKIRYDPYSFRPTPEGHRASLTVEQKRGYCVMKAVTLAAVARYKGIPARLGFGNVKNHLMSPRLLEYLKSDLIVFHGYTELFLDGKWVKATPAFNKGVCRAFKVAPLDFNGRDDSLFQENNGSGGKFMEYTHEWGAFAELPIELMGTELMKAYPHLDQFNFHTLSGDFEAEAEPRRNSSR